MENEEKKCFVCGCIEEEDESFTINEDGYICEDCASSRDDSTFRSCESSNLMDDSDIDNPSDY